MIEIKPLSKEFERFAYEQTLRTAFNELLDWTLLPLKQFDTADDQISALESFRTHPKVNELTTLITMIGDLSEDLSDPIGELYMDAISNGHNGQYFTPQPICDMMALMSIGKHSLSGKALCSYACARDGCRWLLLIVIGTFCYTDRS